MTAFSFYLKAALLPMSRWITPGAAAAIAASALSSEESPARMIASPERTLRCVREGCNPHKQFYIYIYIYRCSIFNSYRISACKRVSKKHGDIVPRLLLGLKHSTRNCAIARGTAHAPPSCNSRCEQERLQIVYVFNRLSFIARIQGMRRKRLVVMPCSSTSSGSGLDRRTTVS